MLDAPLAPLPPAPPPLQPGWLLVSTVDELIAAVKNPFVGGIMLAPGTYKFTSSMCDAQIGIGGSALCIGRTVTLSASAPGTVVLDAQGDVSASLYRRVLYIYGGSPELINLDLGHNRISGTIPSEWGRSDEMRADYSSMIILWVTTQQHF